MNEANQLSEMWCKIKVLQSLKRKYASIIIFGHIIPSTHVVCFRFMNILTVVFREIFDFLKRQSLRRVQPLKKPKLLPSNFDLEGTPRLSVETAHTPHFLQCSGRSVAGWMMSPYCLTGPAGGIKGVEAPQGFKRGKEQGL